MRGRLAVAVPAILALAFLLRSRKPVVAQKSPKISLDCAVSMILGHGVLHTSDRKKLPQTQRRQKYDPPKASRV
jgi:hypothetical protein